MKPTYERQTLLTVDGQPINQDTGEVMEGFAVWIKSKVRWHEDFFMGIQESFGRLAKEPRMTFEARRVLDYCLSRMGFENHIHIPQEEIARELGMKQPHVSRAFKLLVEIGILLEGPKIGRSKSYRLNSQYAWRGRVRNLSDRRRDERTERQKNQDGQPATIYAFEGGLFAEDNAPPPAPSRLDTWVAENSDDIEEMWRKNPVDWDSPGAVVLLKSGVSMEIVGWMEAEPMFRLLTPEEIEDHFGHSIELRRKEKERLMERLRRVHENPAALVARSIGEDPASRGQDS